MRQIIIIIALALLSVLPLAGCITDDSPDNTITPLSAELENLKTTVTNHTTKIAKLEEDVAKKADSSRVDNLVTSMGQPASVNTYTKAEVDAKIAALQAEIAAIKSESSNANNPVNPVTAPNQIAVKTYSMSPQMIYGSGDYTIFVEVKNGYTDAKKIILTCTLTPDTANVRVKCFPDTKFSTDSPYVTGTGDRFGTNVSACGTSDLTNLIMGTSNQIIISGNSSLLIPVKFTLKYMADSNTAIWTPAWSVTIIP